MSTAVVHWKFSRALETLGIPSSVMAFAVSCSLILIRLQNCSINEGKVVALITVNFWSLLLNLYGLVYLVWKQVVFLANNFCTGPVFLACSDTADLRLFCLVWTRSHEFIWNGFSCIETTLFSFYLIIKCESYPLDLSTVHTVFCKCNIPSYQCSSVVAKINMWIKQYSKLRLDYQPLFGKMSPHSYIPPLRGGSKTGPRRRRKSSLFKT